MNQPAATARLNTVAWVLALLALAVHFVVLSSSAVNVPFWDDWDVLAPGNLDHSLSLRWLFSFHDHHRQVPTYLLTWALYRLGGWNVATQLSVDFALYAGLVVGLCRWLEAEFYAHMGVPALVLASAVGAQGHFNTICSCWTFFLIFFFLSVALALRDDRWSWLSPAAAIACAYSFLGGYVCALFCVVFLWYRKRRWHGLAVLAAMAPYFVGYPTKGDDPHTWPLSWTFWSHYLNLLSGGFGWLEVSALPGAIIFTALLGLCIWWALLARKYGARKFAMVVMAAALLAMLGLVSAGRSWAGPGGAKSGRYLLGASFLVPLLWEMWWTAITWRSRKYDWVAWLACAMLLCRMPQNFLYRDAYAPMRGERVAEVACLRSVFFAGGPVPPCDPYLTEAKLRRAGELGVSFIPEQASWMRPQ